MNLKDETQRDYGEFCKPFLNEGEIKEFLESDPEWAQQLASTWVNLKVGFSEQLPGFIGISSHSAYSKGCIGLNMSNALLLSKNLKSIVSEWDFSSPIKLYDKVIGVEEGCNCGGRLKRVEQLNYDDGSLIIWVSETGAGKPHVIISTKWSKEHGIGIEITSIGQLLWLADALEEIVYDLRNGFIDDSKIT